MTHLHCPSLSLEAYVLSSCRLCPHIWIRFSFISKMSCGNVEKKKLGRMETGWSCVATR